ncbi:hypothetical protein [Streptomyces sp. NPDC054849]
MGMGMGMGTVVRVVSAVLAAGGLAPTLVRAARREAEAERVRLAEQARVQAVRSLEAVWGIGDRLGDDRAFEEYVADSVPPGRQHRVRRGPWAMRTTRAPT